MDKFQQSSSHIIILRLLLSVRACVIYEWEVTSLARQPLQPKKGERVWGYSSVILSTRQFLPFCVGGAGTRD